MMVACTDKVDLVEDTVSFTVVIPVYNAEKFLQACLDSVYNAAAAVIVGRTEVIVVDDGSSDGSYNICERWGEKCRQKSANIYVQIIRQPNGGVGAARNCGIEHSHGTWIWFVDADDMIHPDSLRILSSKLQCCDADSVFLCRDSHNEFCQIGNGEITSFPLTRENVEHLHRPVWLTLFRRSLLEGLRFEHYVLGEDILFSTTYLNNHRKWVVFNAPVYYYRQHDGSASHREPTLRRVQDWVQSSIGIATMLGELTTGLNVCVSWYPYCQYYTYDESMFRLPRRDARKCFADYLRLVNLVNSFWPLKRRHRFVILLLNLFPSYILAKLLIYYPYRIFRIVFVVEK